uniref:Uncharacterized protein n=1 Tax=Rhizophagus irregularis (strain DAOM 181602 / DAOM 197198 / MUCL 43194) TaxID=747089 RepID=U9SYH1_RHIID
MLYIQEFFNTSVCSFSNCTNNLSIIIGSVMSGSSEKSGVIIGIKLIGINYSIYASIS